MCTQQSQHAAIFLPFDVAQDEIRKDEQSSSSLLILVLRLVLLETNGKKLKDAMFLSREYLLRVHPKSRPIAPRFGFLFARHKS